MDKVTVVIPNYNGRKYLDDCLKSLYKQTFKDFCVVVIDNGSSDNSSDYIKTNYPQVKLVELDTNIGFAGAVNIGIRQALSRYVFLLNNDTICDERALEYLVSFMEKKDNVFAAQAKMLQVSNTDLIDDGGDFYCALGWAFTPWKDKKSHVLSSRKELTSACAGAAIYRRDIFDKIGLFDEEHFCYLEDVDIGYRARLSGYSNVVEPDALVYHVGSASSGSRHNAFKVELTSANNLYLIYKNMPILQILINLPFILAVIVIKQIYFTRKGLGRAHFGGLIKGFAKIAANLDKKVAFGGMQYKNCILLQLELWLNCIRRLGAF